MAWVFISIVLLMRVVQNVLGKAAAKLTPNHSVGYLKHNAFYMWLATVPALILFLISIIGQNGELYFGETLLYASLSGIALAVSSCCSLYAMTTGTMVLNSLFGTAGLLVPSIAGIFLYGEYLTVWQYIAIVIFIVGAYFLMGNSKTVYGKFTLKTLLVLILNLVMNGVTMLSQTMFARSLPDGNVSFFSLLSFAAGAIALSIILGVIYIAVYKYKDKPEVEKSDVSFVLIPKPGKHLKLDKRVYIWSVFLAVAVFLVSQLITLCAATVSPVILFSITCGGATIISSIVGTVVYKEKFTKETAIGLVLGIGALIMIKVFAA